MRVTFLNPAVWWAAVAMALPIAVHLLTRARRTPFVFPTVRFLDTTRLTAASRRHIQDWPLLLLRIAIVVLAVAALAGPIVVTPGREAAWRGRVARAVVLDDRTAAPEDELRTAVVGRTFARARLADSVRDAAEWLAHQTPLTKEIVVLSAFRRGSTDAADFAVVPTAVGIRLVRTANASTARRREIGRLASVEGRPARVVEELTLEADATGVREVRTEPVAPSLLRVTASPDQQELADAALRAVLRRGLRLPPAGLLGPLTVEWTGDVEALAAALERQLTASLDAWEPETLSDRELGAIARPPSPEGDPTPVDVDDRRMAWALVLGLLVAEYWIRQGAS